MRGTASTYRVDIKDAGAPWAKVVLEAAETLAGRRMEIGGPAGHEYFMAPTPQLANLCRKWLRSPSRFDPMKYTLSAERIRGPAEPGPYPWSALGIPVTRGNVQNSTVTVICGMPHEQVVELVKAAALSAAGDAGARAALLVRLTAIVPANSRFPVEAVARFLEILNEQPGDPTKLADRFTQIAHEHVRLLQEISAFRVADPQVQALREAALAALQGVPDHDRAKARLEEARQLVRPSVRPSPGRRLTSSARKRPWRASRR